MVAGFQTKNSTYYFDSINKTITGGVFKNNKQKYINLSCLVGNNAYITLENGKVVRTGTVERYI